MDGAVAGLKVIHIISLSFWVASLFYLPGLFAAHGSRETLYDFHRLRAMTRMTYLGIASPAAIIAILSGASLIYVASAHGGWLVLKLVTVALMVAFHVYCGTMLAALRYQPMQRHPAVLQSLVIFPAIFVPTILYLVLVKPV